MTTPSAILDQLFAIPIDADHLIIYAPLKRIGFVANPALAASITAHCAGGPIPREGREYLDVLDRLGFFEPESPPFAGSPADWPAGIDTAVLFLTNRCNLRCTYCYACAGDDPQQHMPWPVARAAIDRVIENVVSQGLPDITVGFHGGGEPSLNGSVMRQCVRHARRLAHNNGIGCKICGAFNGYWDRSTTAFILDHFSEVSLSFDGIPRVQNHQRPTSQGGPSSHRVERSLRAVDRAGLPYGIRMTVTDRSLAGLPENVSYICQRFKPGTIQVEPVFFSGRAMASGMASVDPHRFVDGFLEAHDIARDHGIKLFYSGARPEVITSRFCLAAVRALVVTPDGDVTTCFEIHGRTHPASDRFIVGRYTAAGGFTVDGDRLRNLAASTVAPRENCGDCFCKWSCAGDCAARRTVDPPAGSTHSRDRCLVNRELTKHLILDRIHRSKGTIWMGQGP